MPDLQEVIQFQLVGLEQMIGLVPPLLSLLHPGLLSPRVLWQLRPFVLEYWYFGHYFGFLL